MKAPWAPLVSAINAGGGWGRVREEKPEEPPKDLGPKRPLGKGLERCMKKLARLKSRGARPRRLARLAERAQRLLTDYRNREVVWREKRKEYDELFTAVGPEVLDIPEVP